MISSRIVSSTLLCVWSLILPEVFNCSAALAQSKTATVRSNPAPLLTRSTTRQESLQFGYGGTVTVVGAPQGSISIEGWNRSEVAITAEIEWRAETEDDLNRLATVNSFVFDEEVNHLRILTTGTHDRRFMRRVAKDFPKRLIGLPWKLDYKIRVPTYTDLEIDAGSGPLYLSSVEGMIRLTAAETETKLFLTGGTISATIASGKANVNFLARSWRGAGAEIRLASGELTIEFPAGFNGDIDASILRSGKIEENYGGLVPRERNGITAQRVKARCGAGGALFQFTVGDGMIFFKKANVGAALLGRPSNGSFTKDIVGGHGVPPLHSRIGNE